MVDKTEITVSPDPALAELNRRVEKSGSQTAVADELEVSPAYLNDILRGRRDLSVNVLKKLGHKRIVVHVSEARAPKVMTAIETALNIVESVEKLEARVSPKIKQVARS